MTKEERLLLKHLAETHAFIQDLRILAIARVDPIYIKKTSGIEETIEAYKKKYPGVYIRYFKGATKRANNNNDNIIKNGQTKKSSGRKKEKRKEKPKYQNKPTPEKE
jgi:hypothetical protein